MDTSTAWHRGLSSENTPAAKVGPNAGPISPSDRRSLHRAAGDSDTGCHQNERTDLHKCHLTSFSDELIEDRYQRCSKTNVEKQSTFETAESHSSRSGQGKSRNAASTSDTIHRWLSPRGRRGARRTHRLGEAGDSTFCTKRLLSSGPACSHTLPGCPATPHSVDPSPLTGVSPPGFSREAEPMAGRGTCVYDTRMCVRTHGAACPTSRLTCTWRRRGQMVCCLRAGGQDGWW